MTAFLIGGDPPLSMRYLAHDLRASVEDQEVDGSEGIRVTVEERRGWWMSREVSVARFEPAPSTGCLVGGLRRVLRLEARW